VKSAYDEFAFSRAVGLIQQFVVSDLSNFYLVRDFPVFLLPVYMISSSSGGNT